MYNPEEDCDILSEEDEIEIGRPANIYSIIRTIEVIEWAKSNYIIDKNIHIQQLNMLLDEFEEAKTIYGNKWKGLDAFCKENGLDECKSAKLRINKGKITEGSNLVGLVSKLTQDLNDLYNYLASSEKEVIISDIVIEFKSIARNIKKAENQLDMKSPEIKKILKWHNDITNRNSYDKLTENEKHQLKADLTSLGYSLMENNN